MSLQEGLDVDALPGGARAALEAVVMVADEPVPPLVLAAALALPLERVEALLAGLAEEYDAQGRGFELRRSGAGWRVYSRQVFAPVVERFVGDGATARLSRAALETLAIIAYRQPVARSTVSSIRGVSADATIRTLVQRGLVAEGGSAGGAEGGPGGAILYVTTDELCERLGIRSVDELPPLAPYLPEADALDDIGAEGRVRPRGGAPAAPTRPADDPPEETP
ncbi:SMC-Scp complex subunit ScpB [Aquipuribacter nitratireducens]|uniref:SMC-Scp complex subunit ScpB n=1 Tax=Aquipuribacter nitratireducens TaxID=650104 RepID=A0ABW0GUH7_9MICO